MVGAAAVSCLLQAHHVLGFQGCHVLPSGVEEQSA